MLIYRCHHSQEITFYLHERSCEWNHGSNICLLTGSSPTEIGKLNIRTQPPIVCTINTSAISTNSAVFSHPSIELVSFLYWTQWTSMIFYTTGLVSTSPILTHARKNPCPLKRVECPFCLFTILCHSDRHCLLDLRFHIEVKRDEGNNIPLTK